MKNKREFNRVDNKDVQSVDTDFSCCKGII